MIISSILYLSNNSSGEFAILKCSTACDIPSEYKYISFISLILYSSLKYLKLGLLDSNKVIDVIIDNLNLVLYKSKKTGLSDLVSDVFTQLSALYFDGYNNIDVRKTVEDRISYLDKKINQIDDQVIREDLYKALTFTISKYSGDWIHIRTEFSYEDKQFLNNQFSKYGIFHPKDMLFTIYQFHIDKVLPDVLPAINIVLYGINEKEEISLCSDSNSRYILDTIIDFAFLNCMDDIKSEKKYTDAFESILEKMIKWDSAKAAVVLDEFRLH